MEIRSKQGYPASALSNFARHRFVLDGVVCESMEGFLQGLKFENPNVQAQVCSLVGLAAKSRGSSKNWRETQTLYWRGKPIARRSREYQDLLDRAYAALAENPGFQRALLATGNAVLKHSIGGRRKPETILTRQEFISRLTRIRKELRERAKISQKC